MRPDVAVGQDLVQESGELRNGLGGDRSQWLKNRPIVRERSSTEDLCLNSSGLLGRLR